MSLITNGYRALNADLHKRTIFGQRGGRHKLVALDLIEAYGATSILDYGCGRADLAASLPGVDVRSYDPAIAKHAALPEPADIVICTDVLEHIEPDCLHDVLTHLASLTKRIAHVVIATKEDGHKRLADGRDPHLIVKPAEWWRAKLPYYFRVVRTVNVTARDCTFWCQP